MYPNCTRGIDLRFTEFCERVSDENFSLGLYELLHERNFLRTELPASVIISGQCELVTFRGLIAVHVVAL